MLMSRADVIKYDELLHKSRAMMNLHGVVRATSDIWQTAKDAIARAPHAI